LIASNKRKDTAIKKRTAEIKNLEKKIEKMEEKIEKLQEENGNLLVKIQQENNQLE